MWQDHLLHSCGDAAQAEKTGAFPLVLVFIEIQWRVLGRGQY
jgi:hypothetical protein